MKNKKIYYENLANSNKFFTNLFHKNYLKFIKGGKFILSKNVENFEKSFSKYIGTKYCLGVGNCLDALTISFKALNLPLNSEVILPSNAYIACVISILNAGLKPVLVEPNLENYNLDAAEVNKYITKNTKAILALHLYGMPCDILNLKKICNKKKIYLIEDCAQSHGASVNGQKTGTFGDIGCFSFYPTKNLGALGDAGAVSFNNKIYLKKIKMLRNYGSIQKYKNDVLGFNSRLDEFQAAFLRIKLRYLDKINSHKIKLAKIYNENLNDNFIKPISVKDRREVFHIYNIRHEKRSALKRYLEKKNIITEIHYPIPIYKQKFLKNMFKKKYPISDLIHQTTLSLPISFSHSEKDIMKVIKTMNSF